VGKISVKRPKPQRGDISKYESDFQSSFYIHLLQYAARYAGLGLCLNLYPQLALWAIGIIASVAGSAVCSIISGKGQPVIKNNRVAGSNSRVAAFIS
jgi:hypothetical protein